MIENWKIIVFIINRNYKTIDNDGFLIVPPMIVILTRTFIDHSVMISRFFCYRMWRTLLLALAYHPPNFQPTSHKDLLFFFVLHEEQDNEPFWFVWFRKYGNTAMISVSVSNHTIIGENDNCPKIDLQGYRLHICRSSHSP